MKSYFFPPTTSRTKMPEFIVFIHILKIVFGLQNKLLFWDIILVRELKNHSFPFRDILLEQFLHTWTFAQVCLLAGEIKSPRG